MRFLEILRHPGHAVIDKIHVAVGAQDDAPHHTALQRGTQFDALRFRPARRRHRCRIVLANPRQPRPQPQQTANAHHQKHRLPSLRRHQIGSERKADSRADLGPGHVDPNREATLLFREMFANVAEGRRRHYALTQADNQSRCHQRPQARNKNRQGRCDAPQHDAGRIQQPHAAAIHQHPGRYLPQRVRPEERRHRHALLLFIQVQRLPDFGHCRRQINAIRICDHHAEA